MKQAKHQSTPTELRALEVLDHVPAGCKLELVTDEYNAPHLRPGEFAIADLQDRELVPGELYLIRLPSSGRRRIYQVTKRQYRGIDGPAEGIYFGPLNRPKYLPNGDLDVSRPVHMSDGPLKPECLPDYLMERVIGIFQAADPPGPALPAPTRPGKA